MRRTREHTMRQSTAVPDAAVYCSVNTEDQGNGFSMLTHLENGQVMTARDAESWQEYAQHRQSYAGRGCGRNGSTRSDEYAVIL
jgi:hypothetical protein